MLVTAGAVGLALMVTVILFFSLSQPVALFTWLTKYSVVPAALVEGVGGVLEGDALREVYQRRE